MIASSPGPGVAPGHDSAADAEARAARGNRRRLRVFAGVFGLSLVLGMAWNLLRPAEYRATARLQLTLPGSGAAAVAASAPSSLVPPGAGGADFVAQVQRLGSRPLLEQVQQRLAADGQAVDAAGGDPVAQLQSMITVHPVPGSTVVELVATGAPPERLAAALNALVGLYREQLLAASGSQADERLAQTRDELARLEQATRERRQQIDRFRGGEGLSSTERDENESVARTRGLATALNTAIEKQALAEAQLRALQAAASGGAGGSSGAAGARDDPTLAGLDSRASQLREELRELGRLYTEKYLEMDPRARAARTRLAELEEQIVQRRAASQAQALAKAQEEVASARANVEQLQARVATERQGLRSFSARFAQAKAMEDDLASIERARREALERLARLEAGQLSQRAAVDVLQAATAPQVPWRPDYGRDAALVLAGSLALGLLAMGVVELFNRPPPPAAAAPLTLVLPPSWPAAAPGGAPLSLARETAQALTMAAEPSGADTVALPAPLAAELTQPEAAALIAAARGPARLACAGWLLGLTTPELMALRGGDVDRAARRLHVGGAWARDVALPAWWVDASASTAADADAPLLQDAAGQPLDSADLQMLLACAAVDAGLPGGAQLTPQRLRQTAIAWWVREGLRFAELPGRVGRIDTQAVAELAALAAASARRPADDIDPLMPALRMAPPA